MSLGGKTYKGFMEIGIPGGGKFMSEGKEIMLIIIRYVESGISSGLCVGVRPEYYDQVREAFKHLETIVRGQEIVDAIIGQNAIIINTPSIVIPTGELPS